MQSEQARPTRVAKWDITLSVAQQLRNRVPKAIAVSVSLPGVPLVTCLAKRKDEWLISHLADAVQPE